MKAKIFLFLYFILLVIEICAELLFSLNNSPYLIFVTKPFLMPILIVWAFLFALMNNITFNKFLFVALIFSMLGDISLMLLYLNSKIFIVGLACFLIAHIIYIYLFIKTPSINISVFKHRPYLVLPVILLGLALISFLYQQNNPKFIQMQIPVIIYAIVILTMLLTAISCYGQIPAKSIKLIVLGTIFFVISDTTIALSKFTFIFEHHQHIARIIIMSFYGTAQFLIVKGYILIHKKT